VKGRTNLREGTVVVSEKASSSDIASGKGVRIVRRTSSSRGGGGTSSASADAQARAAEQARQQEAARVEAARVEAARVESIRVAQEAAARQAQEQKRNELYATRNARIQELARSNVESGISSGGTAEANARVVIQARDNAAINRAGDAARARAGPTGTVTKAPKKTVVQKVVSKFTRTKVTRTAPTSKSVVEEKPVEFSINKEKTFTIPKDINLYNKDVPGGTMQNYGSEQNISADSFNIYTSPTIEYRIVDSFKAPDTGKNIPIGAYFLIEPPTGTKGGIVKETQIYPEISPSGTTFKIEGYKNITIRKDLVVLPERTRFQKITEPLIVGWGSFDQSLRTTFTKPIGDLIVESTKGTSFGGETGLTIDKARSNIKESTEYLISGKYPKVLAQTGSFISGAGVGIVEDIKYNPGKQVAILAVSGGLGYGLGALNVGATAGASAIFGTRAGGIIGSTLKVGQVGAGLYLGGKFVGATATSVSAKIKEGEFVEAGSILGVASKDIGLGAYGFRSGEKLFTQTRGWWATRGREELITQQGEYPSAPSSKQLEMFKKNVIPELGDKPGAFHTTGKIFWKDGKIVPQPGTSELPGLYGSTQVSTPFARITGSGSNAKLLPNLKTLFEVPGKPGVAYIKPTGFRYSATTKMPNIIGDQKFSYRFVSPPKAGYADVPLIKEEIETIFRPDAGSYGFESGKYFTKMKGVRVPIDVFGYDPSAVTLPTPTELNLVGGRTGGITSYSSVPSYPIVSPEVGFVSYSGGGSTISVSPLSVKLTSSSVPSSSSSVPSSSSSVPSSIIKSYSKPSYIDSSIVNSSVSKSSVSNIPSSINYGSSSSKGYSYGSLVSPISNIPKPIIKAQLRSTIPKIKGYGVQVRRGGQFFNVGTFRTQREALERGVKLTSRTLAATFKLTGKGNIPKAPKGFRTKKGKSGSTLFIEKRSLRLQPLKLSSGGEVREIQRAKAKKKTKSRRKKK